MRRLTNGLSIVRLCDGWRARLSMLGWLVRYAVLRAFPGAGRRAIRTARYRGLVLTMDWLAAEHVPLREVLVREEYWPEPRWRPSPGDTVVDVGANTGVFTIASARLVGVTGRVVAIEPNPAVLGRLNQNIRQNGFESSVIVLPIGIAGSHGRGVVQNYTGNSTIASVRVLAGSEVDEADSVALETLDAVLETLQITGVDVLKIDVEGLERAVLEGAPRTLAHCRRAVVEVGDARDVLPIEALFRAGGLLRLTRRRAGADSGALLLFAERPVTPA